MSKNQLISALLLMTIAEKEGGEIGEILSVASMMGLQPIMSSRNGDGSSRTSGKAISRVGNSIPQGNL
jgi:hypothetical protein